MLRSLGIALLCLTALVSSRVEAEAAYVIVKPGDALSLIAERSKVSVEQLREWNRLDGDLIRVGQKLIIRQDAKRPPPRTTNVHEAKPSSIEPTASRSHDDGIDWTPPFDYAAAAAEVEMEAEEEPTSRIAARDPETAVAVRSYDKPSKKKTHRRRYRVQSGDTLAEIALRHDTTIPDLLEANPGLNANRIHVGQTIDLGEPVPAVVFKLERGDTVLAAASRYGVSSRDLQRWNGNLEPRGARPGTSIRIHTRTPVSPSEAIGPTNRGRLENGVRLPPHRGYTIRNPDRAYGTEETTRWIMEAIDAVNAKYKYTKVVRIHDISDKNGGKLRDHKSHQNGRDADISYYQENCPRTGCPFEHVKSSDLDVARQWALLEYWLRNGQAEMIFIDYRLQAKLYRYAKRKGATKAQLERWMQYPRGRYEAEGIIRHFPNHEDHLHVRFVCAYSDVKCRP